MLRMQYLQHVTAGVQTGALSPPCPGPPVGWPHPVRLPAPGHQHCQGGQGAGGQAGGQAGGAGGELKEAGEAEGVEQEQEAAQLLSSRL